MSPSGYAPDCCGKRQRGIADAVERVLYHGENWETVCHWVDSRLCIPHAIIPGAARARPKAILYIHTYSCGHTKIARVRVLSWPLPVLTGLYFLRVTEVLPHNSAAVIGQLITQ